MGRRRWTTPDQRKWLEPLIPAFLEAQENGCTKVFYPKVYEDWEKAFPPSKPTEAQIKEAGGEEQAKCKLKEFQDAVSERTTKETKCSHSCPETVPMVS